jgi:hypothetical protein
LVSDPLSTCPAASRAPGSQGLIRRRVRRRAEAGLAHGATPGRRLAAPVLARSKLVTMELIGAVSVRAEAISSR